jgi:hypothetical protein
MSVLNGATHLNQAERAPEYEQPHTTHGPGCKRECTPPPTYANVSVGRDKRCARECAYVGQGLVERNEEVGRISQPAWCQVLMRCVPCAAQHVSVYNSTRSLL